nr:uncharacterized protein LOC129413738 isoform X1 [Misgurnus anguillicaudatus]
MSNLRDLETGRGADVRRKLNTSAPAADRKTFALPGAVPYDEWSFGADGQSNIMSSSAQGLVTSSGERDAQRRLCVSAPAARHMRSVLPRTVNNDEWVPAAGRQTNIKSTPAQGQAVTRSGVRDAQPRLSASTPAARHMRFVLPGTVDNEEWFPAAVSTPAQGPAVIGSGVLDAQRRLSVSTTAADQESSAPSGALEEEERSGPEPKPSRRKRKSIRAFLRRTLRAIAKACCICANEDEVEPFDPQAGPSGLLSSARKKQADLQKGSGLNQTGQEPPYCRSGSSSLELSAFQEAADHGPFDLSPCAPADQADFKSGISYLHPVREQHWQNSPIGLEPAGLFSLETCQLQEEDDLKCGPFDHERHAQPDHSDSQSGSSYLHPAREKHRQYSPIGLEPASLFSLETCQLQEEDDLKCGPFDHERHAQPDHSDSQSGSSYLHPAREKHRQYSPIGLEPASLFSLETCQLQEEDDLKCGPFDHERHAQPDHSDGQSGSSYLHPAREKHRQYSPIGLEPASFVEPDYCQSGSSALDLTAFQEAADLSGSSSLISNNEILVIHPFTHQEAADSQCGPFDQDQSAKDQDDPLEGSSSMKSSDGEREMSLLYEVGNQIGIGSFGKVFEGIRKSDGKKVAIKYSKKMRMQNVYADIPGYSKPLCLEVAANVLLKIPEKSPHIVEMLDWYEEEDKNVLIMEFPHPCTNLEDFLEKNGECLPETQARDFMRQALLAYKHCLDHGVYHYDFKLDNFLVNTETMQLKLIDFGISMIVPPCDRGGAEDSNTKREFATSYMVYMLGVLLFKLLHGGSMASKDAVYTATISNECRDMLDLCLERKPGINATLEDLFDHPFFKKE